MRSEELEEYLAQHSVKWGFVFPKAHGEGDSGKESTGVSKPSCGGNRKEVTCLLTGLARGWHFHSKVIGMLVLFFRV